jgi:PTS system ascorbate-specific IIA component
MVGILLVTHNGLGDSLLDCIRHVTGQVPAHVKSLSVLANDDPLQKEKEGRALLKLLETGDGVLILTDIYGATPSNIANRLCQPGQIEGIAGVNLPMLLRVACGTDMPLKVLFQRAIEGGRDCIVPLSTDFAERKSRP